MESTKLLVLTNLPDRAVAEKLADAAGGEAARRLRQHPRAVPLGLPLEGRGAARRGAPDAHQDHRPSATPRSSRRCARATRTNFPRSSRSQSSAACLPTSIGSPPKPHPSRETLSRRPSLALARRSGGRAMVQEGRRAARAGEGVPLQRARARGSGGGAVRDRGRLLHVPRQIPLQQRGQSIRAARRRRSCRAAHATRTSSSARPRPIGGRSPSAFPRRARGVSS